MTKTTIIMAAGLALASLAGCNKTGHRPTMGMAKFCKASCAVIKPVCGAALAACQAQDAVTNGNKSDTAD